ncbi:MAG: hypothetical protein WDM81_09360 [Rhizomicrobium sp.]
MQDVVVYNPLGTPQKAITLAPDATYAFADWDKLRGDAKTAAAGIDVAIVKSTQTVATPGEMSDRSYGLLLAGGFALLAGLSACTPPPPPPVVDIASHRCAAAPDLGGATALAYDPKSQKDDVAVVDDKAACLSEAGASSLYRVYRLPGRMRPTSSRSPVRCGTARCSRRAPCCWMATQSLADHQTGGLHIPRRQLRHHPA